VGPGTSAHQEVLEGPDDKKRLKNSSGERE